MSDDGKGPALGAVSGVRAAHQQACGLSLRTVPEPFKLLPRWSVSAGFAKHSRSGLLNDIFHFVTKVFSRVGCRRENWFRSRLWEACATGLVWGRGLGPGPLPFLLEGESWWK